MELGGPHHRLNWCTMGPKTSWVVSTDRKTHIVFVAPTKWSDDLVKVTGTRSMQDSARQSSRRLSLNILLVISLKHLVYYTVCSCVCSVGGAVDRQHALHDVRPGRARAGAARVARLLPGRRRHRLPRGRLRPCEAAWVQGIKHTMIM